MANKPLRSLNFGGVDTYTVYQKPDSGIPKSDLASAVQTSLGKADTALQSHQDISGKVDKVQGKGLSTNDYSDEEKQKVENLGNAVIDPKSCSLMDIVQAVEDYSKHDEIPTAKAVADYVQRKIEDTKHTNKNYLPEAIGTDGTVYNGKGFKENTRLSSSGSESALADTCASGFIPVSAGDIVNLKNISPKEGTNTYVITYDSSFTKVGYVQMPTVFNGLYDQPTIISLNESSVQVTFDSTYGTGFTYFRFSCGTIDGTSVVTINESGEDVPSGTLEEKLAYIRNWDAPIFDNEPVHLLSADVENTAGATFTPAGIYAKYDALMAQFPQWITKTDLGLCSDGVNHVYRYDFVAPEPHHYVGQSWSEKKPKAILVSGIHYEWAGIYGLFYALREIMTNPAHYQFRANVHLIVIPCANPYCTIAANYNFSMGVLNANGVQIHRNFEVGFIYPGESGYVPAGQRNHGGAAPLSEIETQYINNILKANTDAAFFLSCHNFDGGSYNFMWPSAATLYMVNMGFRLIDKMSDAWNNKYDLSVGISAYKPAGMPVWDNRLGEAGLSNTDGTEVRQATKYGIQSVNVEVCPTFTVHGTTANPEPSMSSFSMSRACETYVNFLRMCFASYDFKDKKQYWR